MMGNVIQTQEPGQQHGSAGIGLSPVAIRALDLRRAVISHLIPAATIARTRPNPLGPAS
jgi:hypothetical protein